MAAAPKIAFIYPYQAPLPPPQTPPISFPTPKCSRQEVVNSLLPHVIPQDDPHLLAYFACSIMPVQSTKAQYAAATNYLANAIFDEESK
eukprot:1620871-Ditylum_brightwellii.AAC.1